MPFLIGLGAYLSQNLPSGLMDRGLAIPRHMDPPDTEYHPFTTAPAGVLASPRDFLETDLVAEEVGAKVQDWRQDEQYQYV